MLLHIKLSRLAELDIEEIWLYTFETWSMNQANFYQDTLYLGLNELALNINLAKTFVMEQQRFYL